MFVFLALVFGFGFVLFGIGAGGTGLGDVLRGSGRRRRHPVGLRGAARRRRRTRRTPQAWRELSTALQTEGDTEEAIVALYAIRRPEVPRTPTALRELGGLYLAQGADEAARRRSSSSTAPASPPAAPTRSWGRRLPTADRCSPTRSRGDPVARRANRCRRPSPKHRPHTPTPSDISPARGRRAEGSERPARARPSRRAGR